MSSSSQAKQTKNLHPNKVLVIGSGPVVIGQADDSLELSPTQPLYRPYFEPLDVMSMEIHLSDLPDEFIVKLDDTFRLRLFMGLDSRLASEQIGISRSYFYHLKNNRHGFRLSTLRKFLLFTGISLEEAEPHVGELISNRGGRVFASLPIKGTASLARLVGHCFGDGNVSTKKAEFDYVNGDSGLIEQVRLDVGCCFKSGTTFEGDNRDGTYKVTFSNLIGKMLVIAGAPRGSKVFSKISVPNWILTGTSDLKQAFLQALFDDDGSALYSEKYPAMNVNLHLTRSVGVAPEFSRFWNDLKQLLTDFGIFSSNPYVARKYFVNGNQRVVMGILVNRKSDVRRFWEAIGFSQQIKKKRLQLIVSRGEKIAARK